MSPEVSMKEALVDTHDTPCTLDTELDAESTSRESAERTWQNPERNERADEKNE